MIRIAFFDTKPYDRIWFDRLNTNFEIIYFKEKLCRYTAKLAYGFDAVCAFVNDNIDEHTINELCCAGIKLLAMRCAGYSNVDLISAYNRITVVHVPAYSPYAVAEFAMALLLTLNRKLHRAYNRTRDFNFSINGLTGTDLHGKTAGIIGTGKIGFIFANICKGFGMNVLAYDIFPNTKNGLNYVDFNTLLSSCDVISLHCPLTKDTKYILNKKAFSIMKANTYIINTSRGALIDSAALLDSLNSGKIAGAGLDVYEDEAEIFYEDKSGTIIHDDILTLLVSRPNVLITSHQAFLTDEALTNIATVTLSNIDMFFNEGTVQNEVCIN